MTKRIARRCLWLTVLWLLGTGCSKSEPEKPASAEKQSSARVIEHRSESAGQTADAAVLTVVDGFRENRPQALWEFLPPGYRRDVNLLAHEFAGKMDPQLWNRTFAVGKKLAELLRTRKQDFLSYAPLQNLTGLSTKQLTETWDGLVGLLETLVHSDLADLERMKSFDGGKFLAGFDARGTAQLRDFTILLPESNPFHLLEEMLAGAEVTANQTDETSALLRIAPQNGEPREFEFVKVEGKWIPKIWAETWQQDIASSRESIDRELDPQVLERKKQSVLPVLAGMETELDQFQNSESSEQFHAQIEKYIEAFVLSLKGSRTPQAEVSVVKDPPAGKQPSDSGKPLTIVVNAVLDEQAEANIADRLLDAIEDQSRAIVEPPITDARTTRIRVYPITDAEAFAKRLDFVIVLKIDEENRVITVEPK